MNSSIINIAVFAIPVSIGVLAYLPTLKKNNEKTPAWRYTAGGILIIILSVSSIVANYMKSENEGKEKVRSDNERKLAQDSLYKLIHNLKPYGIQFNFVTNTFLVSDTSLVDKLKASSNPGHTAISPPTPSIPRTNTDIPSDQCRVMTSARTDNVMARCVFVNKTNIAVTMYWGKSITNASGKTENRLDIATDASAATELLWIGSSLDNRTPRPATSTYKFYFVTTDPGQPKKYGTINIALNPCQEATIELNNKDLILTPSGEKSTFMLQQRGLD